MSDQRKTNQGKHWENVTPTSWAHALYIRAKLNEEEHRKEIFGHEHDYYEQAIIKTTEKLYSLKRKLSEDQKAIDQCIEDLDKLLEEKKIYENRAE